MLPPVFQPPNRAKWNINNILLLFTWRTNVQMSPSTAPIFATPFFFHHLY